MPVTFTIDRHRRLLIAREVRRAFVAATPYLYRMACLFVTLAQPYQPNVQVFRDIDEALAWLAS